jgi:hypothetical protein
MLCERFPAGSWSLVERRDWHPRPEVSQRQAWESLPEETRGRILRLAEARLDAPWPLLSASLYLEYARTGDRELFEGPYFWRRATVCLLALAECMEDLGRFLSRMADGIWLICEESTWCVPAHVSSQRAGMGLPDTAEPVLDLFAAETGAGLAWISYLLGPRLPAISPLLVPRIQREVEARIIEPFLTRDDFWWMGFDPALGRPNNWNPWVNGNVLSAACLLMDHPARRAAVAARVMTSLDRFLDPYPADGGCDEGPDYWSRAAGSVFDCLETLESVSSGAITAWDEPLVRHMGGYLPRARIDGDFYVNFADASAVCHPPAGVVYGYGKKIGDEAMACLGASLYRGAMEARDNEDTSPERLLRELFRAEEITKTPPGNPLPRDTWLPVIEVMFSRDTEGDSRGFFIAAKGGHNGESHNHNDVGSFIVSRDGLPLVVDAGVGVYTRATFRPDQRYKIWTMQSAFHTLLPTVDGVMQAPGREFAARGVSCEVTSESAVLSLDIAPAYPGAAGIQSWKRRIEHRRGAGITVTDHYSLARPAREVTLSLLTPCKVRSAGAGVIHLRKAALPQRRQTAEGTITVETAVPFQVACRDVELHDERLEAVWGPVLHRVTVTMRDPAATGSLQYSIGR